MPAAGEPVLVDRLGWMVRVKEAAARVAVAPSSVYAPQQNRASGGWRHGDRDREVAGRVRVLALAKAENRAAAALCELLALQASADTST